jgi:hypothetical protein
MTRKEGEPDQDPNIIENLHMQRASGGVQIRSVLVAVLYDLLRDHVQPGVLEKIIRDNIREGCGEQAVIYSNGWLANYADHLARRITESDVDE